MMLLHMVIGSKVVQKIIQRHLPEDIVVAVMKNVFTIQKMVKVGKNGLS